MFLSFKLKLREEQSELHEEEKVKNVRNDREGERSERDLAKR